MNRMLVYIAFIVLVVDKACKASTCTSASWNLATLPLSFGKDIILRCIIDNIKVGNDSHLKVRQWTGGKNYDMLCTDGECRHPNKYEMLTRNTSKDFELLIHTFSESDLDYKYTCTCGFDSCTRKLFVEPNHVMSLPTMTKLMKHKNNINKDSMDIEIMLDKVNPVPNCTAWFEGRFINDATVTVMKWYTYHNDVKVIFNVPVTDVNCEGRLQILCNFVYRNVTIFDEHIDICHGRVILFGRRCWTKEKTKQSTNVNQDPLLTADTRKQEKETSPILNV